VQSDEIEWNSNRRDIIVVDGKQFENRSIKHESNVLEYTEANRLYMDNLANVSIVWHGK
jgi:hypothetical protein